MDIFFGDWDFGEELLLTEEMVGVGMVGRNDALIDVENVPMDDRSTISSG